VSFWDIPTGKCDERNNKEKKVGLYRPAFGEEKYEGHATCLEMEPHLKFIAVGAEDGYMMFYEVKAGDGPKAVAGLPPNNKKPATKHPTKVNYGDK